MKTRNKLLLSASAMLVLSAGAMVTGTVAWFTATRQVDVNFSNVKVMTTQADMAVELVSATYTATPSQGVLDISGVDSTATDISGDGVNFYKPVWGIDEGVTALEIDEVTDLTTYVGYYVEFQLEITRTNPTAENGFMVYLGSGSAIEPLVDLDAEDEAAVAAARVAILDDAKTARTVLWTPDDDDASYQYLDAAVGETAYGVDDFDLLSYPAESSTVDSFLVGDFINHTAINGTNNGHINGNSPVIADLSTAETETITVRIWIEGVDEDALNIAKEGQFTITLELYSMGFSI
ncbi:MAG: hypothetical protein WC399_04645 [Bacilli bacterium]|jgi:hypothetical protein